MTRRAADLLVDCLAAHSVDRVFCVPGESYLAVLDALHERKAIETVVCRHESGAGFMAVADGKLTGRPGIAFVSRGPGATNASIAVHVAEQDAVPLILFIGQVPRTELSRRSFQGIDYGKTFADMAKLVVTVEDPGQLPEIVARAFVTARAPTPGPVVIVLPEDMLEEPTSASVIEPRTVPRASGGSPAEIAAVAGMIAKAKRPLLVAGGGLVPREGREALLAAAEVHQLPVALSFKRQELFPNAHPLYAGHLGYKLPRSQVALYAEADLVLAVGTRLGEVTTQGYTFPASPVPKQPLIHVYDDHLYIGRNFQTAMPIVADPTLFLTALAGTWGAAPGARAPWIQGLHGAVAATRPWSPPSDGLLDMGAIVTAFDGKVAADAVLITDAGNFAGWLHRHFPFNGRQLMIGSVGGAMGNAMPAAVAAGLRLPGRQIITWIGDGGALMTGSELATAVQYGVPVKVFISNNGSYGTIRLHQEKAYKGRVHGTSLKNPDFAKWAESFGARGLTVRTIAEAPAIVAEALACRGPVIVDVKTAIEHIAPGLTVAELRR
jgi:acetolactate synthase I/II/III large subunit